MASFPQPSFQADGYGAPRSGPAPIDGGAGPSSYSSNMPMPMPMPGAGGSGYMDEPPAGFALPQNEERAYPPQDYPPRDAGYAQQQGYPPQASYGHTDDAQARGYPPEQPYPEQRGYPPQGAGQYEQRGYPPQQPQQQQWAQSSYGQQQQPEYGRPQGYGQDFEQQRYPQQGGYGGEPGYAQQQEGRPPYGGNGGGYGPGAGAGPGGMQGEDGERGLGTMALGGAAGFAANKLTGSHQGSMVSTIEGALIAQGAKMAIEYFEKHKR